MPNHDGRTIECALCETRLRDVCPAQGHGWDLCGKCRANIIDSKIQDDFTSCAHCFAPLDTATYCGTWELTGNAYHLPGKYRVFECSKCFGFSRHHAEGKGNA